MRVNPQTGQLENDDGTPVGPGVAVPMDQVQPAVGGPPPGMLAANQRAGRDLSMPVVLDRGGNDSPPMGLPPQALPDAQTPAAPVVPPMVRDTSTTSRTREVPLPQEREAMKRVTANDQEAVAIAGQQGEVDKQKAATEAESAQARAAARQLQATQTTATVDQGQAAVADAKAKYDAENARLSGMDVRGYWDDKSVGQKVLAAISIAMSGVGGALTGRGGNAALDVINKAVDDDYRLQRARIDVEARKVEGAKEGVQMARQTHADAIANLELKQAATWNQIGAAAEAKAAQNGTQSAAVQAARIQQEAAAKRDAHLEQWFEGQRAKVTSTTTSVTGTGTAGADGGRAQGKMMEKASLAAQLADDFRNGGDQVLSEEAKQRIQKNDRLMASQKGSGLATWLQGVAPGSIVPTNRYEGLSPREAQIANSQRLMAEKAAALNYTAGGEKSLEAMVAEFDPTVPGGGNSKQKIDNIRNIMNANAGLAGKQMGIARAGVASGAAGAPAAQPQARRGRVNGRPALIYPDGHYELQ